MTDETEKNVKFINVFTDWKVPIDKMDLRVFVKTYLDKKGITDRVFKDNMPGNDWAELFIKRYNLTQRLADNVRSSRLQISTDAMELYFQNLSETLQGIPERNIFNYDETNVTDDPSQKKCVVCRGLTRIEQKAEHSKQSISIMFSGNAVGEYLPPMVVYKAKNVYEGWMIGGPKGTIYDSTPSGWFDMKTFEKWFFEIFLKSTNKLGGPKVIIMDNLGCHFSVKVIETCLQKDIRFIRLVPNTTHLCQPLDLAVFRPLKTLWRKLLNDW